jgi:ubiquinone/menaquinone biosynthesis C-methylase UbiE
MISQRSASAASVIQGFAEDLPLDKKSFDAAMAIFTVRHWSDGAKGIMEMRRMTRSQNILLTYDPSFCGFWLADTFRSWSLWMTHRCQG